MPQASTAAVNDSAPSDRDDGQFDWLPSRNGGWIVARGMVLVLLGILAILAPGVTLFAFAMLFAALSFVDGIFALIAGIRGARREERWGAMVFSGILGIGIGILFLLFPLLSTLALAYTFGRLADCLLRFRLWNCLDRARLPAPQGDALSCIACSSRSGHPSPSATRSSMRWKASRARAGSTRINST